ncbi:MAG: DUF1080 domain-containing protein [Planctomycetota bacterium]
MNTMKHAITDLAGWWKRIRRRRLLSASAVTITAVLAVLLAAAGAVCLAAPTEEPVPAEKAEKPAKPGKKDDPFAWKSMFDGKTLEGWKVPVFGGDGEVTVKDGTMVLGMGDPMTGITYTGKLPRENYEVQLEAKRTQGIDFFATTTFPVGKDHCSFVTGGWAGTVVGISCVDFYDASDNITTQFLAFDDNKWYKIRIRVSEPKIECWIGEEKMVDLERKGHKFDVRMEVDLCKPFGISSYTTEGVLRNLRIRSLKPEEVAEIKKETEKS